jgi:hypothetical protein
MKQEYRRSHHIAHESSAHGPAVGGLVFMNVALLNEKMKPFRDRFSSLIDKIFDWVLYANPFERSRINPYEVADRTGTEPDAILSEFLYGTVTGLFDLHWGIHCPRCNMVTDEVDELHHLPASGYCEMCQKEFQTDFQNLVEITFSLNRKIEDFGLPPISFPPPATEIYFELTAIRGQTVSGKETLPAGKYRYVCPITRSKGLLNLEGKEVKPLQILDLWQLEQNHFDKKKITARPGQLCIRLTNTAHPISGLQVFEDDLPEISDLTQLPPRLTGLEIIRHPDFQLFFGDYTPVYERLKIRR